MSFTMKMLAVSVLVIAMMALTRGAAPVTEPPVPETVPDGDDAPETEPPLPEKKDMEPVPESTPNEEADELGSGSEGSHNIAKRATRCACGWSLFRGRCVRYFSVAKTWAEAQRHCQKMGANLASVHNKYEENWMKRLAGSRSAWIGFSDAQQERFWFWINGARITYLNWCRGQPDNAHKDQDCVQFNWSGGKCWDDDNCLARKAYICAGTTH